MPQQPNVITQNPRDFAVQIRKCSDAETIIGTGVVVSMNGAIVTCAHVVRDAVGAAPCESDGVDVPVYFPQVRGGETQLRNARIAGCFPEHDDDVVLLQLTDGPAPLAPEQIAKVGAAAASFMNPFVSYGFRALPPYNAGFARGTVMGCVDCPADRVLLTDPVQLDSKHISGGMSCSPVLDQTRNLVIGIISETYYTPEDKDRDTAWAVDAHVLSFEPLNLSVQDAPQPKRAAPRPQPLPDPRMALLRPRDKIALHGAPTLLDEWVGRDDLLNALDGDWSSDTPHVTTLIGFVGEGKSSLARKWLSRALRSTNGKRALDGVFWWSFYDEPSVETFFEAALTFLSNGQIDPRRVPSASAKGHLIAGLMAGGRYLFVLDGFEVMQHNEGDSYGLVKSNDLRAFLKYAAAPGHESFCLITSRAPVLDLLPYTTATQRDVTRLSEADGRDLLRAVGVKGLDTDLDRAVQAWDGHALTLSLLGTYLAERHGGDIAHLDDIPAPTADEPRYERVHRVLRRYDEHLTDAEREFLTLFSAFRTPVGLEAFNRVFRGDTVTRGQGDGVTRGEDDAAFAAMVARLTQYRLLRHIAQNNAYTTHPLVRAHYYTLFTQGSDAADAHTHIKNYYLEVAGDTPTAPTLDDLHPLIEAAHHACRAGAYNEAYNILRERINNAGLTGRFGAWETMLTLMLEFFPNGDTNMCEPQVRSSKSKGWILNAIGLCLMSLGYLGEAISFYERSNAIERMLGNWFGASTIYRNLAELHLHLGNLPDGADAARKALAFAFKAGEKEDDDPRSYAEWIALLNRGWKEQEYLSLGYKAWVAHLRGDIEATKNFAQVEKLCHQFDSSKQYAFHLVGIWHADHLWRLATMTPGHCNTDILSYARYITEVNLEICKSNRAFESMCYRVLGNLDSDESKTDGARAYYDEALRIARGTSDRPALIEALLARGRFYAKTSPPQPQPALSDLEEALAYALQGGWRIYEADIRVALAWAYLSKGAGEQGAGERGSGGDLDRARQEAQRAREMSEQMGYYWGRVDAEEVLGEVDGRQ